MRLTGYASRGLRLNYSSMKLEFLAHKWTVTEKFLLGHKCNFYTDKNILSHLSSAKPGTTEQCCEAQLVFLTLK